MPTVIGEGEPRDQLRGARHGGHQLAGVVDGEGLVAVDAWPVQHHLDQGPILGVRALERLSLLGAGDAVHEDNAIPSPETSKIGEEHEKKFWRNGKSVIDDIKNDDQADLRPCYAMKNASILQSQSDKSIETFLHCLSSSSHLSSSMS